MLFSNDMHKREKKAVENDVPNFAEHHHALAHHMYHRPTADYNHY